jgi:hypothetical protein
METRLARLRALGKQVAHAQDLRLRATAVDAAAVSERLAGFGRDRGIGRSPSFRKAYGALAAAAAIGLVIAHWQVSRAPLHFEIGPSQAVENGVRHEDGRVGEWIASPPHAVRPLRFSDGSVVILQAGSLARVASVTSDGAHVVVQSGSAQAHVVHRERARWDVEAGPFHVRVVGTDFDVNWDPATLLFRLALQQGKVVVSGCSLPEDRPVVQGEVFQATCRDGQVRSVSTLASARSMSANDAVLVGPNRSEPGPMESGSGESLSPGLSMAPIARGALPVASGWEGNAAKRDARDANDDRLDRRPYGTVVTTDVARLMKLADEERFAGRIDSAAQVLWRIREQSPGDPRASVAAFQLGRIAFDRGDFREALVWFNMYIDEQPGGALCREAEGRVMEALDRGGNRSAAEDAAKRYLARYPDGPHAKLAKTLSEP